MTRTFTRTPILLSVLALMVLLVWGISLRNGFVWDDANIIVAQALAPPATLGTVFTSADTVFAEDAGAYYRPLNRLTYLFDYRLYRLDPIGYHAENLLLHLVTVMMLFLVARRISGEPVTAFVAAALFAIHPVQAEAVNFLSGGRNTILATLFSLAALLCWDAGDQQQDRRLVWSAGLLFFCGLLCKETALMLLPFLGLRALLEGRAHPLPRLCRNLAPLLLALGIYLVMRHQALSGIVTGAPAATGTLLERIGLLAYIVPRYLFNLLWPARLSSYYTIPPLAPQLPLLLAVCAVVLCCAVLLIRHATTPVRRFALLWLGVNLLPVSNLIPIPSAALADRYLYLAGIGLWLLAGDGFTACYRRTGLRTPLLAGSLAVMVALAVVSGRRSQDWKDDITLNESILRSDPRSSFAYYNLGGAYKLRGEDDRARRAWGQAVQLDPRHSHALNQLGNFSLLDGAVPEALAYFSRAVEADPRNAEAHYNRAMLLERLGRRSEAARDYELFLRRVPVEYRPLIPDVEARINRLRQLP